MFPLPSPTVLIAAGGVFVTAVTGSFVAGAIYEHGRENVADLKARNAALQFDLDEANGKAVEASQQAARIAAADHANQETIDAAEEVLARGYGCVTPAERDWLLHVGQAGPRTEPPTPPVLRESGDRAAAEGCDAWPTVAARERAGRLKANAIIAGVADWYRGLQADYRAGRPLKTAPAAVR